jgi:hypothetical protein
MRACWYKSSWLGKSTLLIRYVYCAIYCVTVRYRVMCAVRDLICFHIILSLSLISYSLSLSVPLSLSRSLCPHLSVPLSLSLTSSLSPPPSLPLSNSILFSFPLSSSRSAGTECTNWLPSGNTTSGKYSAVLYRTLLYT